MKKISVYIFAILIAINSGCATTQPSVIGSPTFPYKSTIPVQENDGSETQSYETVRIITGLLLAGALVLSAVAMLTCCDIDINYE